MRISTPHHIVDRHPKPHKRLYPGVLKLHGLIADERLKEIGFLQAIKKRTPAQERELQRLLAEK
jgi:hypothetical protein